MDKMWNFGISFLGNSALEGNLFNFEGKFIIKLDILVFLLQKHLQICKQITFLTQFYTIFQGFFLSRPDSGNQGTLCLILVSSVIDPLILMFPHGGKTKWRVLTR